MTDWKDRLLDNLLDEKMGGESPPDQVEKIVSLAREQVDTDGLVPETKPSVNGEKVSSLSQLAAAKRVLAVKQPERLRRDLDVGYVSRPTRTRWFHRVSILAVGMTLVIVMGTLVSIVLMDDNDGRRTATSSANQAQGQTVETQTSLVRRDGFIMPDTARTHSLMGRTMLSDGWLYADEQSPSMMVGYTLLEFHGAKAVVWVGQVPDSYEAAAIAMQLRRAGLIHSEEDLNMLYHSRNWIAGLGLAMFLFSGQAVVNSQEVQSAADDPSVTVNAVFDRFDVDDSGIIELDECVCDHSRKCDLDEDGEITREEFSRAVVHLAGSHEALVHMVHERGGVEAFYQAAKEGLLHDVSTVSMEAVFAFLDKDESGVLEPAECICPGTKSADRNEDGEVTREEISAVAVEFFGSEEAFLGVVREKGGIEEFFQSVMDEEKTASDGTVLTAVFRQYDRNESGRLEAAECVCHGSKMADANEDGIVTKEEMRATAIEMFGSIEQFEKYVEHCGGPAEFYAMVSKSR